MAWGNVVERLGGPPALAPELVDQGLIGGSEQECSNDVIIGDVGQHFALLGEVPDVLMESFPFLR